jgi:hypothetical protein
VAGQGETILATAERLRLSGWTVLFVCIPNRTHVGVIPIPVAEGASNQRYTDVISLRGETLRLTEVEVRMSPETVDKTVERFREQVRALGDPDTWLSWSARVQDLTGHTLPATCVMACELVVCAGLKPAHGALVSPLTAAGIQVFDSRNYQP